MAWLLETSATKNTAAAAINATTGANSQETLLLATLNPLMLVQLNSLPFPFVYVYYSGTYQQNGVFRITTIVCGLKSLLTDGSFPLNVPPQGN